MQPQTKNNRAIFWVFVAVFALPVALAKLALDNQWFEQAATNKGDLLQPTIDMSELVQQARVQKWKLLYVLPASCAQDCENALYSMTQVHSALGRQNDRAEVLVVSHENSDQTQLNRLQSQDNVRILTTKQQALQALFGRVDISSIFIADTLDNVILRYPLHSDTQAAVQDSRNILADLRKVLKLSRIG